MKLDWGTYLYDLKKNRDGFDVAEPLAWEREDCTLAKLGEFQKETAKVSHQGKTVTLDVYTDDLGTSYITERDLEVFYPRP